MSEDTAKRPTAAVDTSGKGARKRKRKRRSSPAASAGVPTGETQAGQEPRNQAQPSQKQNNQARTGRSRRGRGKGKKQNSGAAGTSETKGQGAKASKEQSNQAQGQRGQGQGRSKRRSGASGQTRQVATLGQMTTDTSVPTPAPPKRRGKRKRPLAAPRIAVGCVILQAEGNEILLVRERGRWSLPKGGLEVGELMQYGARRETYEETGLVVELRDLAFMVEFNSETWGHHLQFFYTAEVVGGELGPKDPDKNVQEARFVPVQELREYIRFRPRLMSLETWLHERRPRHFVFDLDSEPAMTRRRKK